MKKKLKRVKKKAETNVEIKIELKDFKVIAINTCAAVSADQVWSR